MPTRIYLSNELSEVTIANRIVYKAYVGFRSPNASTSVSVARTGLTAGGTDIAFTLTSGGTQVLWLTQPLLADATIANCISANLWGNETASTDNAQLGFDLSEYTTSVQAAFVSSSRGAEASTSAHLDQWSQRAAADETNGNYTSTTIDAGNRIVVQPRVYNVGTMAPGNSIVLNYNGSTAGANGDTFVTLTETVRIDGSQYGDGATAGIPGGPSTLAYGDFVRQITPVIKALAAVDGAWLQISDEFEAQSGGQAETDASLNAG